MSDQLKLMCVFAHPDDETLATGGTLIKYAAEGIKTYLVTATRGERGWTGDRSQYPGLKELGEIRESELLSAAQVLGIQDVFFLDYIDGDLNKAPAPEVIAKIAGHIRRIRPQVLITFDPFGVYGHPDHIAISQHTTAAVLAAANNSHLHKQSTFKPHVIRKLYYNAELGKHFDVYQSIFGDLRLVIDGQERSPVAWEEWAITTRIDTYQYWETRWKAVLCHRSQWPGYKGLENLSEEQRRSVWGTDTYYRAISDINSGLSIEEDLFAGLRG